ncbi:oligosaccharide repeat unit polymerase [bacterium]|nr:oligosaccharide repeat unit polymerase [bacterium]
MQNILINIAIIFVAIINLLLNVNNVYVIYFALIVACFELYLWAKNEKNKRKINWAHPVPVFVLGYCIVYYQLPYCYLNGYDLPLYSSKVLFYPQNISYCIMLSIIGLASFFLGEEMSINLRYKNKIRVKKNEKNYSIRLENFKKIVLIFVSIFFLLYIRSIGINSYFGFDYGSNLLIEKGLSRYFYFAYSLMLYLLILIELARVIDLPNKSFLKYIENWDKLILFVTVVTLVPFLLSGDRGAYLQPLALIFVPYFLVVKPLNVFGASIIIFTLSMVLAIVGDTRGRDSASLYEAISSRLESATTPAEWPTMELASSFGTFNIATGEFPEKYPYNNGMNTFYSVMGLFPFSSYFTEIERINKENDYVLSSGLFFTNILTEGTFASGAGTSSLADIYMDYGPYGIPVILFMWGLFMGWICEKAIKDLTPVFVFLYAYYSYYGIYVNRSSFAFGFNNVLWVIVLFLIIDKFYLSQYVLKSE